LKNVGDKRTWSDSACCGRLERLSKACADRLRLRQQALEFIASLLLDHFAKSVKQNPKGFEIAPAKQARANRVVSARFARLMLPSVTEQAEPKASVSVRSKKSCSVTLSVTERPGGLGHHQENNCAQMNLGRAAAAVTDPIHRRIQKNKCNYGGKYSGK
jgi:hypothetical protein